MKARVVKDSKASIHRPCKPDNALPRLFPPKDSLLYGVVDGMEDVV